MLAEIKQKIKPLIKYLPAFGALAAPFLAKAYNDVQSGLQTSGLRDMFGTGGLNNSNDLFHFIAALIQILLLFAGAIAVVFVIIGGYYYITAQGNEEQVEKGKKTLINAIIGIVVVILSYAIINVISNLVSNPYGTGI